MNSTILFCASSLVIAGCMSTQFAAVEPTENTDSGLHIRITLDDGSRHELRHAEITSDVISGTDKRERPFEVATDKVRTIEQAVGKHLDAGMTLLAVALAVVLPPFPMGISGGPMYTWNCQ